MQTLHTFKKVCAIKRRKGIPGESRMWNYFKAQNGKPPVGYYQVGAVSVWHAVLTKSYPDPSTPVFPLTGWKNISLPSSWASQLNILKTWKFIQYSQKHKALTSVRGGESPPGSTLTAKWDSIPPAQHCHTSLHCWEATLDGLWKKEKKKKIKLIHQALCPCLMQNVLAVHAVSPPGLAAGKRGVAWHCSAPWQVAACSQHCHPCTPPPAHLQPSWGIRQQREPHSLPCWAAPCLAPKGCCVAASSSSSSK